MGKLLHNMVNLHNTCFQKLKSSNVFYAHVANDASREATSGPPQELASKRLVYITSVPLSRPESSLRSQ